ncbi:hypothetical protein ACHQM5_013999 [Ranunculus cassubicifolius]
MDISSLGFPSLTSINHHRKSIPHSKSTIFPPNYPFPTFKSSIFSHKKTKISTLNTDLNAKTMNPTKINTTPSLHSYKDKILIMLMAAISAPFPCSASETFLSNEPISNKIDLEAIVVAIDDFFNRNPFFVSGVTFIWLVVIPLTEEYFKKCKFISANDAFRKLKNESDSQLLDIRNEESKVYLDSPNLKVLGKSAVRIEFVEGEEDGFVKKVLRNFKDPKETTICILDDFDGKSMEVAELLFKKGFKEAYAIKGGLRGKNGWQAIQETLLPPSLHVVPKKVETTKPPDVKEGEDLLNQNNGQISSIPANEIEVENGYVNSKVSSSQARSTSSPSSEYLSPYPNYPDLKPPSSPTPSKPES